MPSQILHLEMMKHSFILITSELETKKNIYLSWHNFIK